MSNTLRQIKIILYRLKRTYGLPITIYRSTDDTMDAKTGDITRDYTIIINVKRAIILPSRQKRDFVYDISYLAANKNFTYGAYFDIIDRSIIIDRNDLPTAYTPKLSDVCVFNSQRYEFKTIDLVEDNRGYIIGVLALTNSTVPEVS